MTLDPCFIDTYCKTHGILESWDTLGPLATSESIIEPTGEPPHCTRQSLVTSREPPMAHCTLPTQELPATEPSMDPPISRLPHRWLTRVSKLRIWMIF